MTENIYQILKQLHKDKECFKTYKTRNDMEAFCFWDGKSRYRTENREGHRMLTFVCEACIQDHNPEVQKLMLDFKFSSTCYRLDDRMYPCGCAKHRGKTLLQHFNIDDFLGFSKEYEHNILTVKECLGGKGNKRKYIIECNVCSLDSELYPYGSLTSTKSNLTTRNTPNCGCNPRKHLLEAWQHEIKVRRICENKNLVFGGWVGAFTGTNTTRVKLICKYHGLSENTRVDKLYIGEGGCQPCSQELGNYGWYKGREDDEDFLYLLCSEGVESFCKIGRSFEPSRRIYQHENLSRYKFKVVSTISGKHKDIFKLETELLKNTFAHKYQPETPWSGGISECRSTDILNHPEIISTFNLKETTND